MNQEAEYERVLTELQQKTGKNLWIQTEDGQILASTFSETERFLRELTEGELSLSEIRSRASKLGLDFQTGRYLFLAETEEISRGLVDEAAREILENCLEDGFCVRSTGGEILLLVAASSSEEAGEYALLLQNALETEAMARVCIGVSDCFTEASSLRRALGEARMALLAIHTFYQSRQVMTYRDLGLGLAALQLPDRCADDYLHSVLGEAPERVLEDKELLRTAQVLLASGLNSAEAARQLCIHRNTLTYRLDKIQKLSGRDLRRFEDAAAFRLAAMIWEKREER